MGPTISFLVPTAGRPEIECCLASIAPQLEPGDEVLVIGDTTDGPLPDSQAIVASFGPQFQWLEYSGHEHTWGHAQLNYGIACAQADYLCFNDDDDVWTPDAAATIRTQAVAHPEKLLLFRFWSRFNVPFWDQRGLLAPNHVGGHCLVCPNDKNRLGRWGHFYQGDWTFIETTVELNGGASSVLWFEDVLAVARPSDELRQAVMQQFRAGTLLSSTP